MHSFLVSAITVLAFLLTTSQSLSQVCAPGWVDNEFCIPGSDNVPTDSYAYDFGNGEQLYVAGNFDSIGCVTGLNRIAMWDGTQWSPLAGPMDVGLSDSATDMIAFDDGSGMALYVCGRFAEAGGVAVNGIAKWDGVEWSPLAGPLGTGVDNYVNAIEVYDDGSGPALYVGGRITSAGGHAASNLAKWDGNDWTPVSDPTLGPIEFDVYSLQVYKNKLYIGGNFRFIQGEAFNRIASWDGQQLSKLTGSLGTGVSNAVTSLDVFDPGDGPKLLVGGTFDDGGGMSVDGLICWDGTDWINCSQGSSINRVSDFAVETLDDGSQVVYIVGDNIGYNYIVMWDGTDWHRLPGPFTNGISDPPNNVTVFDDGSGPAVFIGGNFSRAGGIDVQHMALWDGVSLGTMRGTDTPRSYSPVESVATFYDGTTDSLYFAGKFQFYNAFGDYVQYAAKYDNGHWYRLLGGQWPFGSLPTIVCMGSYNDGTGEQLYFGGSFSTSGGLARWDGTEWSKLTGSMGTGTNGIVYAIAEFDDGSGPAVFIGGEFATAGGIPANNIAKWNGAEWEALETPQGNGTNNNVYALAVHDDGNGPALYAGGSFSSVGGISARSIAKWDGNAWSPIPANDLNGNVYAFEEYDAGNGTRLYVGGTFTAAGSLTLNRIAEYTHSGWSALEGTSGIGLDDFVTDLQSFDDGTGPALFACGGFERSGTENLYYIAKWNGQDWLALAEGSEVGLESRATEMTTFDDGNQSALYVVGYFNGAGAHSTNHIAAWASCVENDCVADTNHDGMLSPTDFTAWINAFNNNLSECDQNSDGSCTPTDFTAWIANYNAGC